MNITKIISKVFDSRLKAIDLYDTQAGEIQHRVLTRLVKQAENTEWGKKYDYKSIRNYEDFKNRLPIQTYEEVKPCLLYTSRAFCLKNSTSLIVMLIYIMYSNPTFGLTCHYHRLMYPVTIHPFSAKFR